MKLKLDIHVHCYPAGDRAPDERHGRTLVLMLQTLNQKVNEIMSAISEFSDRVNAHNEKIDAAITGIAGDITALNAKVAELQASQGKLTPEDEALLAAIEARGAAAAEKLDALDSITPPPAPPA